MKTLYVSDLDGTLLRSNDNKLTDRGMIFSYATAVISSNDEDGVAHWPEDNYIVK